MENMNDIVKVAIDAYHGSTVKYSHDDSMKVLREAAIEANGGSTKLDYRAIRDGKCSGLFTLLEEVLSRVVVEGLQNSDFFNQFVDFRNLALGDKNEFLVEDSNVFTVSKAADGTQAIRRQRIGGFTKKEIETDMHVVKIYEELNRVLSGAIDFNQMINKVGEAFSRNILDDIYALWDNAVASDFGGATYYPVAGSYNEATLLETIAHVEAAAGGKPAVILGTKAMLRNLAPSQQGEVSRSDLYNQGYYGKFYGTSLIAIPNRHKVNSTNFVFDDKTLTIVAGDDKPIKFRTAACFKAVA